MSEQHLSDRQQDAKNSDVSSSEATKNDKFFVVGIGASAGGLKALEELFGNLPTDSGAAFVVIQHLAPDFKSLMKELLERRTDIAIYRVADGMELHPNAIYLIPPGQNLLLEGNFLRLQARKKDRNQKHELNFPINIFFKSLAENFGERSIGVILSGSGSDGTEGIKAIKEVGGNVLVQEPTSAEFDGMPLSAIETGVVDRVLPIPEISQLIHQFIRASTDKINSDETEFLSSRNLKDIIDILVEEEDLDFSHYKTRTISRRIERRYSILNQNGIDEYIKLLETSEAERKSLGSDLLINVTHFFRDYPAWENLKKNILPLLIEQARSQEELRFWVTACSTGEEAYSLAIVIDEILEESQQQIPVKIFATDIDRHALEKASQGIYPASIANNIEPERLQKYFIAKDNSYQVVRKIRKKIIFSPHDLTTDTGFTRMHFISCRNVLIYLQPQLQNLVLRNLHFSLVTKGVLFLGESETVEAFAEEFKPLDRKWKIYRKRRDVRLPVTFKGKRRTNGTNLLPAIQPQEKQQFESFLERSFNLFLADSQAVVLIIDRNNRLLHVYGNNTARYFKAPDGKITTEVTKMVISSLHLPISASLHRARKEKQSVFYSGIKLENGDTAGSVSLKIIPSSLLHTARQSEEFYLIRICEEVPLPPAVSPEKFEVNDEAQKRNLELEQELQDTRGNLQALVEELETTNEEQQASNEELTAANEELQSTNEELHSVNEELYTLNSEYQAKIQELIELNNDVDNLLESTDIGVVFLDRELKIRKFTPAATAAVALRREDIDRPIEELSFKIDCPDLHELFVRVLTEKQTIERKVKLKHSDSSLLMRLHLYFTEDGNDDGIVISFVKLDEIEKVQQELEATFEALRYSEERLSLALSAADIGTWTWESIDGSLIWDERLCQLYGIDLALVPDSLETWLEIIHPEDRDKVRRQMQMAFHNRQAFQVEYRVVHTDGKVRWLVNKGKFCGEEVCSLSRMAGVTIDITEIRRTEATLRSREAELRKLNQELERRVKERTASLANFTLNLRQLHRLATTNYPKIEDLFDDYLQTGCDILGLSTGIVSQVTDNSYRVLAVRSPLDITVGRQSSCQNNYCGDVVERRQTAAYAEVMPDAPINQHPIYRNLELKCFIGTPIFVNGKLFGTLNFSDTSPRGQEFAAYELEIIELMARDIGQILASQRAQQALKASEARFRSTFEQAAVGIAHVSLEGKFIIVNQRFCHIVDYPAHQLIRKSFQEITYPEDLDTDLEYFQQMLRGEIETYSLEKRYVKRNGSPVWINLTVSPVKKDGGEIAYFIGVIEDISDRKEAEAALAESRVKLERANQAKDSFIAHMSHELRTPLNSILGFSEILQQDPNLSPQQFQNVDIVNRSGRHLLTLINDILDFSKIEAGKLDLESNEFNLRDFLQNITDIFQLRARQKGLKLSSQIDSTVPKIIKTDETRLRQVLLNLLSNAIKFTQTGGVVFSVGYGENNRDGDRSNNTLSLPIRFQVEDTGSGIPQDKLASIFFPFEQLPSNFENHQGTGLGLTISQNIVRLMNSEICVESSVEKGSKFWFDLELSEAQANSNDSAISIHLPSCSIGKLKRAYKVLIVDDNSDNRFLLVNYLQPLGFIVEEASNGKTGLAKAEVFHPDVILLDLVMPLMDGKEMSARIRQHSELKNTKIFIISASSKIVLKTEEIDCQSFLSKPIDLKQLLQLLETHLELEWITEDCSKGNTDAALPKIKVPSELELFELLELARLGDIETFERQLETLVTIDSQYASFGRQTMQIAASFQQHKLIDFIEQFL